MIIYPDDNNNSNNPSDWVEAEEADDEDDDEFDYDPNKPIMHLRRVEGIELIWCKFRNRFFPQSDKDDEE